MAERRDEDSSLSPEDHAFVGRLVENFAPPALSASRRASLDAELRDRVARPRGLGFARPAFASAVAGLAIGLALAWGGSESLPPEAARPGESAPDAASLAAWEWGLFDPESYGEAETGSDLDELPDDFAAIAGIFLDG